MSGDILCLPTTRGRRIRGLAKGGGRRVRGCGSVERNGAGSLFDIAGGRRRPVAIVGCFLRTAIRLNRSESGSLDQAACRSCR
jgi:hypothetical protein